MMISGIVVLLDTSDDDVRPFIIILQAIFISA